MESAKIENYIQENFGGHIRAVCGCSIGQLKGTPSNEALIGQIFAGTGYKVAYEPNMEDYLLCHAAFVLPVAFACCYVDSDLRKLKGNSAYWNRMLDANVEGYRAIERAGHKILPASDHAMNAIEEMSARLPEGRINEMWKK